jgi:uncharacterized protein HemX
MGTGISTMIDKTAHQADNNNSDTTVDVRDVPHSGSRADRAHKAGAWFAVFLATLALFFTAIGIAVGYKHWQRMNDKATKSLAEIAVLHEQLKQIPHNDALEALRKELGDKTSQSQTINAEALQEMARMQNQTRQFADTVASQVEQVTFLQARMQQSATPSSAKEWQVAEIEFLLQVANRELYLANNVQTAKASLKEADALLAKLGSVNYLPVRQQVARDISALDAAAIPDIASLSQRISAMMLTLKPLPAATPSATATPSAEPDKQEFGVGSSWWDEYKSKLSDAVIIRRADAPLQAALDGDARQILYNLLHLRLETLRLLSLQHDNAGFHAQLDLLKTSINAYYPKDQAEPLLKTLDEFASLDLQPVMPDISASLKQLESARQTESTKQQPPAPEADSKAKPAAKEGAKGGKGQ